MKIDETQVIQALELLRDEDSKLFEVRVLHENDFQLKRISCVS